MFSFSKIFNIFVLLAMAATAYAVNPYQKEPDTKHLLPWYARNALPHSQVWADKTLAELLDKEVDTYRDRALTACIENLKINLRVIPENDFNRLNFQGLIKKVNGTPYTSTRVWQLPADRKISQLISYCNQQIYFKN